MSSNSYPSNHPIEYYRWETRGENNCPLCSRLAGEVMSIDEWSSTIIPGFHENCDCTLVLDHVSYSPSPPSSNILVKLDPFLLSSLKQAIAGVLPLADMFFASIGAHKRQVSLQNADPIQQDFHPANPGGGNVNLSSSTPGKSSAYPKGSSLGTRRNR